MASAAELAILIKARDEASAVLGNITKGTGGLKNALSAILPTLAAVGGAFVSFQGIKSSIASTQELAGEVNNLRRITGLSVPAASELAFQLQQVGLDADSASGPLGIFAKNMLAASQNITEGEDINKNFGRALAAVGITALTVDGQMRPMEQLLPELADQFKAMKDGPEESALAMQLFGRSGRDLLPLLNQGREGLAAMAEEARRYGLVLTEQNLGQIKAFTAAQRDMEAAVSGIKLQFGLAVTPALTAFMRALIGLQPMLRGFIQNGIDRLRSVLVTLAPPLERVFGFFGDHKAVIVGFFVAVVAGVSAFSGVIGALPVVLAIAGGALGFLLSPIGLLIAAGATLAIIFRSQVAAGLTEFAKKIQVAAVIARGAFMLFREGLMAGLSGDAAAKNVTGLQSAAFRLGATIREIAPIILHFGRVALTAIVDAVKTAGPVILDFARGVLTVVVKELKTWGPPLQNLAKNVSEMVRAFMEWGVESGLFAAAFEGVKTIAQGVAVVLGGLYAIVKPAIQFFMDHKEALLALAIALGIVLVVMNPIPAAIIGIILAVGLLREHWDEIKAKTLEVWNAIGAFLHDHLGFIVANFNQHFGAIKTVVESVTTIIRLVIENWMDTIRDVVVIVMALLRGDWGAAWDGLKNLVHDRITFIKNIVVEVLTVMKALAGVVLGEFVQLVTGLFGDLVAGIRSRISEASTAGIDLGRAIFSGVAGILGSMFELGKSIIQMIWAGIVSLKDWLFGKAGEIAGGIKDKLDPRNWKFSPENMSQIYAKTMREAMQAMEGEVVGRTPALEAAIANSIGHVRRSLALMRNTTTGGGLDPLAAFDFARGRGENPSDVLGSMWGGDYRGQRGIFDQLMELTNRERTNLPDVGPGVTGARVENQRINIETVVIEGDARQGLRDLGLSFI